MDNVTGRRQYKYRGKKEWGLEKHAKLQEEAERHHVFAHVLNAPNARRRSLNQSDSNNVLFNMPPPAKMRLTRVNSAEKADSPLSPRAFRSNMLFNTPPVKRVSVKHAKHSPRSNSSERAHVRLSPSAFKSKKARQARHSNGESFANRSLPAINRLRHAAWTHRSPLPKSHSPHRALPGRKRLHAISKLPLKTYKNLRSRL